MVRLTKINKKEIYINADLMEFIESTPDTLITLTTGKKILVSESVDEVIKGIIEFRRRIMNPDNLKKK